MEEEARNLDAQITNDLNVVGEEIINDTLKGTFINCQTMASMTHEEKASEARPIESSEDEDEPENDLSCGPSSFGDEDERKNLTENLDLDEIEEVVAAVAGINPYQFEPYASDSETTENEEGENPEENRLQDNSW
ncbi:hypothetical protein LOTGIDRAFT_171432 [Lottia gigantea]|uniref:Uncharacterized protein n=1 Tax=Lottia gigantea TaxID=225164 RepID=V4AHG5_LOTGI|nr:hypothetical protein LOTGIDRAFT_171432 [Lottia gigantea]ESP03494.1 hypothetical protein LOTGIDRAFT_171432 [Lottia gigantea]